MSEWKNLNEAPEDEFILVWCRDDKCCVIAEYSSGRWVCENGFEDFNPSHWMPLPPPPESAPCDSE